MLIYAVPLYNFVCRIGRSSAVFETSLPLPARQRIEGSSVRAQRRRAPRGAPLQRRTRGGEVLDDADDRGEGRGDRQAQRQQQGRGDLIEQTFEASERHDTHL